MTTRLNLLLLLVPASWIVAWVRPASPWLFVISAASILPLAAVIGDATSTLAYRSDPALGGLLNATFGNAAELIIGLRSHRCRQPERAAA